ncbi:Mannosyl-oligosaccharide 1,2-alpha-mannosidase IB [Terramyces sp. JEL0728]|nr:Mannosyl-oligosaccharide 1,2-alpha-mannosidase IB [Terramyces sp. JEL0728]
MYFTAIDSLDTLFIMGLVKEYEETKELVLQNMDVGTFDEEIIVFEITIRVLGGLLSAYDFDPDKRYIEKAVQVADLLLKAFDTNTGIPTMGKQSGHTTGIATMGTLQLEFQYLSDITQEPKYQDAVFFAMDQIRSIDKPHPGLFPSNVHTGSLQFDNLHRYGIGADVDSFYEYLLKIWISTGEPKFRQRYDEAAEAVTKHLMVESGEIVFFPDKQNGHSGNTFHHLTCFTGGMFGLGANSWKRGKWTYYLDVARRATDACWEGYKASKYGIGGEIMAAFNGKVTISDAHFTLR